MRIFRFDPKDYREQYKRQGWVHIPGGTDPEFLSELQRVAGDLDRAQKLDKFAIKGKKEQALYDFPASCRYPDEIFDVVASVCGLRRKSMTLSERHIQIYEPTANPEPQAHKDRFPSQVSVGFSIAVPEQSRLVLYPYDRRELNPFNMAAALIRHLQPDELPDVVLRNAREVVIADHPGDVVMFPGSSMWHLRRRAASVINLYLKMNDFDCDPLGEDPRTASRREHTLKTLQTINGARPDNLMVKVSRRLDCVAKRMMPNGSDERLEASLYGDQPFGITERQLHLLRAAHEAKSLGNLLDEVETGRTSAVKWPDAIRLLELGALDVLGEGDLPGNFS
jgi:hypothetical protein